MILVIQVAYPNSLGRKGPAIWGVQVESRIQQVQVILVTVVDIIQVGLKILQIEFGMVQKKGEFNELLPSEDLLMTLCLRF